MKLTLLTLLITIVASLYLLTQYQGISLATPSPLEIRNSEPVVSSKTVSQSNGLSNPLEISLSPSPTPSPITPSPSPSASPTPIPDSCALLPILMYHHVQNMDIAKQEGHASLTVDTATFRSQMQYLKDQGYQTISPSTLVTFFRDQTPLPKKSVIITFDDGYANFSSDAFPILQSQNFQSIVFLPTGLMDNPGYLSWVSIQSLSATGLVQFGNHTWSHHAVTGDQAVLTKEITTAHIQLSDHALNQSKIFAYPYGTTSANAQNTLRSLNYELAFTTKRGTLQCASSPYGLQRIRIGNSSLRAYGL